MVTDYIMITIDLFKDSPLRYPGSARAELYLFGLLQQANEQNNFTSFLQQWKTLLLSLHPDIFDLQDKLELASIGAIEIVKKRASLQQYMEIEDFSDLIRISNEALSRYLLSLAQ